MSSSETGLGHTRDAIVRGGRADLKDRVRIERALKVMLRS